MPQIIPMTPSEPWYTLEIPLDDDDGSSTTFVFEFKWNTRDLSWYMNLSETDGTPIVSGVRMVLGMYLGRRSRHNFFRHGVLVLIDTSNKGKDAGFDDMGTRVILERITTQEIITGRSATPMALVPSSDTTG